MTAASSALNVCLGSIEKSNLPSKDVDVPVVSISSMSQVGGATPASLDILQFFVIASELSKLFDPMALSDWVPTLKPNATVSIHILGKEQTDLQPIHTSFLLAGLAGASEQKSTQGRIVTATRKVKVFTAMRLPPKPHNTRVTISLDDDDDDEDDDLIDEDGLLDDELAPPTALSAESRAAADDCSGRKACDNCSCGRAEIEAAGAGAAPPKAPIQTSSCGNCSKGDAFRCGGCPYLGKPAFKTGEEHLVLDLTDDF